MDFRNSSLVARHYDTEVRALGYEVPEWVNGDITLGTCSEVWYGGVNSGAYMPACEYYTAAKTMNQWGDEVLDFLVERLDALPNPLDTESWSGMACHYLGCAVEVWALDVLDRLHDEYVDDEE